MATREFDRSAPPLAIRRRSRAKLIPVTGSLTPLEERLVNQVRSGAWFDCSPGADTASSLDDVADWEERRIRAEVLTALCEGSEPGWVVHPRRGLRVRGAWVTGTVDLSDADLAERPLTFDACRFDEGVNLCRARVSWLSFTACDIGRLDADELDSNSSLDLSRSRIHELVLIDATIRCVLSGRETRLGPGQPIALVGDDCRRVASSSGARMSPVSFALLPLASAASWTSSERRCRVQVAAFSPPICSPLPTWCFAPFEPLARSTCTAPRSAGLCLHRKPGCTTRQVRH